MFKQSITVNGQPFFGRVEEQKQFRSALSDILTPPPDESLPYVLMLYGDGGIGKSTLAQRFYDIARTEYREQFHALWMDWENERLRNPSLQVGRERISTETVFDTIHATAHHRIWGQAFVRYEKLCAMRDAVEQKAAEALTPSSDKDEWSELRGAGASALAKVIRISLPVGETGEKLARSFLDAGIKVGAIQAAQLRVALENRLRAKLDPEQLDLFLTPHEQLARALAAGLRKISEQKPLLLFLDTYEIVDRADLWLRVVMKEAGRRVMWVIAGRNDLMKDREFGGEYFKGYPNDFPRRLLPFDMRRLAQEDIQNYFTARVPDRSLNDEELELVSRATRGIPLAIREAADIWAEGRPISNIVGDTTENTPRHQIVRKMTARYLVHCMKNEDDKRALYALALGRGNLDILRAMLQPNLGNDSLNAYLGRLERDYASVHLEEARLHDEPAAFFVEDLKSPMRRTETWVQELTQRAINALQKKTENLNIDLSTIEERCEDEDWVITVRDLTDYLFWVDERKAWQWFIPRFVESLAYGRDLYHNLMQVVSNWENWLSKGGKKRVKAMRYAGNSDYNYEEQADMLTDLIHLAKLGWLAGEGEAERFTIINLKMANLLYERKQYTQALQLYENAERELPKNSKTLRQQLAAALSSKGEDLWRHQQNPDDALRSLQIAVSLNEDDAVAWHGLGHTRSKLGYDDEAIVAFKRSLELDPRNYQYWGCLAEHYRSRGHYREAIDASQRIIETNPRSSEPYYYIGVALDALGNYDKALIAYQKAIDIEPNKVYRRISLVKVARKLGRDVEYMQQIAQLRPLLANESVYNRACFEAVCGNVDAALLLIQEALKNKNFSKEFVRNDPDFDLIRTDPRFKALVGE